MKNLLLLVFVSTLASSCIQFIGSKKVLIDENILVNDISINLSESALPNTMILYLKEKINCDIQLEIFYMKNSKLIKARTINTSDFIKDEYSMDWYYSSTVVKAINTETTDCTLLDMEMRIF